MSAGPLAEPLAAGDLCHHGLNSYPIYEVICVDRNRVWLRDISSGLEGVVDIARCHKQPRARGEELHHILRRAVGLPLEDD